MLTHITDTHPAEILWLCEVPYYGLLPPISAKSKEEAIEIALDQCGIEGPMRRKVRVDVQEVLS